ncbi:MAG: ammonium transporter [Pseudomonadota bacterium]
MNKDVKGSLAWAAGLIGLALAATGARHMGWVDGDTATRLVVGANGLMVAWYGNRMPKAFVPSARARQITRFAGWAFVLSGLAYAGLWAFAPIPVAVAAGCGVVLAGMAATLAYGWSLRSRAKPAA